jgi:hypothetical protein
MSRGQYEWNWGLITGVIGSLIVWIALIWGLYELWSWAF